MGFDDSAIRYLTSQDHRKGDDLDFLKHYFDGTRFKCILDVACGAGHFATVFDAEFKVMCDISTSMLKVASGAYGYRELVVCRAEYLPFCDGVFDLVGCRIALHHFDDPQMFFYQARRVLGHAGLLVLVDSIVDVEDAYLNRLERLRDASHRRSYSPGEILNLAKRFRLLHFHSFKKRHDFADWAYRVGLSDNGFEMLQSAFLALPDRIKSLLELEVKDGKVVSYTDRKGIFVFQAV